MSAPGEPLNIPERQPNLMSPNISYLERALFDPNSNISDMMDAMRALDAQQINLKTIILLYRAPLLKPEFAQFRVKELTQENALTIAADPGLNIASKLTAIQEISSIKGTATLVIDMLNADETLRRLSTVYVAPMLFDGTSSEIQGEAFQEYIEKGLRKDRIFWTDRGNTHYDDEIIGALWDTFGLSEKSQDMKGLVFPGIPVEEAPEN